MEKVKRRVMRVEVAVLLHDYDQSKFLLCN